ncbi:hypothetical protein HHK36_028858 [Tetracentron sinense]|uniref:Ubiquitin-like domain-containing protein n=1 Tax=Tetracentron sinense TaxID=13715 RepID=A0A835D3U2_TETSI|nr:hypothetical protein HHK36_028858 [Tetracentron sinense]
MMRMKAKTKGMSPPMNGSSAGGGGPEEVEWELRPGGMLVQKRDAESDRSSVPSPTIKVRVKYGSSYHEIPISSQATFGDLKKLLAAPTGLHHQDQMLLFKDKERDSNSYLDIVGVKDRSKIVLVGDPTSQERRFLEMRKNAKMEKASKSISEISLEVDKLAGQVSALETVITSGGKVAETDVLNLIELLMTQLLKLDGTFADGDVKLQRRMQVFLNNYRSIEFSFSVAYEVLITFKSQLISQFHTIILKTRRVQKYVETLDQLKIRNAMPSSNGGQTPMQQHSNGHTPISRRTAQPIQQNSNGHTPISRRTAQPIQQHSNGHTPISRRTAQPIQQQQQQTSRHSVSGAVVVTTQWETFDSAPPLVPASSTSTKSTPSKLNWEFFD